jgi:hypothetical protein
MDYSKLVQLGLLQDNDQQNAAQMGLFNMLSQIGAASAPRTSPTPPPIDLSKAMNVYQSSMKNALTQGALRRQLEQKKKQKEFFTAKPVDPIAARRMAEATVNPLAERYARTGISSPDDDPESYYQNAQQAYMPSALKAAESQTTIPSHLSFLEPGKARALMGLGQQFPDIGTKAYADLLTRTPKEAKYHNVLVGNDTKPQRITTQQMEMVRQQGETITPYSAPLVNQVTNAPNEFDKFGIETWKKAETAATKASQAHFRLKEMKALLATGVPTGKLASWTVPMKNILASFGVVNGELSIQEAIVSLGNEMALGKHGPGMGPMTDADFKIYQGIVVGLKNTPAGNALIMARMEREYLGREMYAEILRTQIETTGPGSVNSPKAWRETASRLNKEYGPLIPQFKKASDVGNDMVGRVVAVVGENGKLKPFLVRP